MKNLIFVLIVTLFCVFQFSYAGSKEQMEKIDWKGFSENLVTGLSIDNDGIRQAAMKHIITYGDYLDVNDGVFDLVKIYRNHKNDKFRQMAVVALGKVQNKWSMYFLKSNLKFEENENIRRQILHAIYLQKRTQMATTNETEMAELLTAIEK
jgi:hypothetical protein